MLQTIGARNITFYELETNFNLHLVEDEQFFRKWQDNLLEITDSEKQHLNRVKASYSNLRKYPPILENTVKIVVLSPLLDLAGFYLPKNKGMRIPLKGDEKNIYFIISIPMVQ
ncbi:hypothetical protein [Dapis sp. BLCC M229]|uniref:hypothetical protein n=1 Tax=Dapis sp. BLCC M229 TaxID=3400188 RepID=UPI003CF96067